MHLGRFLEARTLISQIRTVLSSEPETILLSGVTQTERTAIFMAPTNCQLVAFHIPNPHGFIIRT